MKNSPVTRVLDIPVAVTFLDLHEILQVAFELENEGSHAFVLGKAHVPISHLEDEDLRRVEESEMDIDRLLEEKTQIYYSYSTREEDFFIEITPLMALPGYQKRVATCVIIEGIRREIGSPDSDLEGSYTVEEINGMLSDVPPESLGIF